MCDCWSSRVNTPVINTFEDDSIIRRKRDTGVAVMENVNRLHLHNLSISMFRRICFIMTRNLLHYNENGRQRTNKCLLQNMCLLEKWRKCQNWVGWHSSCDWLEFIASADHRQINADITDSAALSLETIQLPGISSLALDDLQRLGCLPP